VVASEVKSLAGQTAEGHHQIPNRSQRSRRPSDETGGRDQNVVDVIAEIDQIASHAIRHRAAGIGDQGDFQQRQQAARGTQEVNSNISGVQRPRRHRLGRQSGAGRREQLSSQSRDLAGQVNRFLSEVRAA